MVTLSSVNKETVDSVIYYLSQKLRDRTPRSLPDKISGLRSLFSIAVTNDGSSAVSEVRLHLPGAEFLRVLGEAQNPAVERKGNVIYLGQMQPKESLKLYVWSSSGSYRYDRLCENSEASKTVEKGNHISPKIDDLIPKSVSFMLQSGAT